MSSRRRIATALVAALLSLASLPAAALAVHEGEDSGNGMTLSEGVLVFLLAPALIAGIVAALAWLPAVARAPRYRPARGWDAPPIWFAGPPDPDSALAEVTAGLEGRGGARGEW